MTISFCPLVRSRDPMLGFELPPDVGERMHAGLVPALRTMAERDAWIVRQWMMGDAPCEPNPNYDARLDLTLAAFDARDLLEELGFHVERRPVPLQQMTERVLAAIERHPNPSRAVPPRRAWRGSFVIRMGRSEGYLNRVLGRLLLLCEAAEDYGATHIGWA